jgi:hypothetical protein
MAEHVAEKYIKKLIGRNHFEDVVQRLRKLTVEGSTMTVPEILDVTDGLFNSAQVVVDGAHCLVI